VGDAKGYKIPHICIESRGEAGRQADGGPHKRGERYTFAHPSHRFEKETSRSTREENTSGSENLFIKDTQVGDSESEDYIRIDQSTRKFELLSKQASKKAHILFSHIFILFFESKTDQIINRFRVACVGN